ncbi:MAG: hypothetical protein AAB460_01590 [Patescibacteria group bacterium]
MENQIVTSHDARMSETAKKESPYILPAAIIVAAVMISGAWLYKTQNPTIANQSDTEDTVNALVDKVLPVAGVELPVSWGDLGTQMVRAGVIDGERFMALYRERGAFTEELKSMLFESNNGTVTITRENADYLLNLFWALGLASKNTILDTGEMMTATNGNAGGMASTGGWTMAVGDVMDHYSAHVFFDLTPEQQSLVDKVSRGIYRPCCGNSTHFPDCNHGMAMLGLLELMASQGIGEEEMYKAALAVNSYWFPDTYITIATYMKNKGIAWSDVSPSEVLGAQYSSGSGFEKIKSQVTQPQQQQGGGGCSV